MSLVEKEKKDKNYRPRFNKLSFFRSFGVVGLLTILAISAYFYIGKTGENEDEKQIVGEIETTPEQKEVKLLKTKMSAVGGYEEWLNENESCVSFWSEESSDFFIVEVHEWHHEGCPGDPNTAPLLQSFRINKQTGLIERFNIVDSTYSTF